MSRNKSLRLLALCGVSAFACGAAHAQAPGKATTVEEVVVVGSQIQGARIDQALPVTVVDQEDIIATGAVSGDELFRAIPQQGDVQFNEAKTSGNLNDARGDVASVNLRNLGTGNTLVLLNGRRVVSHPGTQTENFVPVQTANTNALPVTGVRRVEVLRDGAGALYGADAVAGVVNTVLETKYNGVRAEAQYGWADKTSGEYTANIKAGTKLDDGTQLMFFAGYTYRDRLRASERDYSASEDHRAALIGTPWEGDTAFDSRSTSAPYGGFRVVGTTAVIRQGTTALTASGQFHVEPVGNTAAPCNSTVYNGFYCLRTGSVTGAADRPLRYDENKDRTLRGEVERTNLFGTASKDFGSVQAFSELGYYHASFSGSREQSAPVGSAPITVPAGNYYNPFGPTTFGTVANPNRLPNLVGVPTGGLAVTLVNYRPVDTGPRSYTVTDDSYRLLGGLRGEVSGWDWESALVYSHARTKDKTHNAISNTLFQRALALSTPAAYNPFNGGDPSNFSGYDTTPSDPTTIQSFLVDVYRISSTSLALADFKVSKSDLFTLPGGNLGVAAGVEFRRETYTDNRDKRLDGQVTYTDPTTAAFSGSDVMGASPSPDVDASRKIASAYLELAVPVISEEMGIPFMQEVNLQLAARDEHYSDFGNVLKPKVALGWKLNDTLTVRGSWSQSFRAPNLPQFYSAGTQVSNGRTDYAFCRINNVTCASLSTTAIRSGNRNLGPEEAENASIGLVLKSGFLPSSFGRFTATVDFWSIKEKNVIGIETDPIQILYDLLQRQRGKTNPNVLRLAPDAGQTIGLINYIQDDYQNVTPRTLEGLDFGIDYDFPDTPIGQFSLKVDAAKLLKYNQSPTEMQAEVIAANNSGAFGTGIVVTAAGNQIGVDGTPKWRASLTASWRNGPWRAGAFVSYVGHAFDTGPALVNNELWEIKSWTTVSLYTQYNFEDGRYLQDSSIRLGVRNAFDKDPPLAAINVGYLSQLHNPTGRYYYVSLAKRF